MTKKTSGKIPAKTVQQKLRKRALYMDGKGKKRMIDLDTNGQPVK